MISESSDFIFKERFAFREPLLVCLILFLLLESNLLLFGHSLQNFLSKCLNLGRRFFTIDVLFLLRCECLNPLDLLLTHLVNVLFRLVDMLLRLQVLHLILKLLTVLINLRGPGCDCIELMVMHGSDLIQFELVGIFIFTDQLVCFIDSLLKT